MDMKLRQHAEERLEKGTAPITRGPPAGMTALTLLHRLASTPATASDALKLLHELQVHQVELDLQHEHAEQDRLELSEDLRRYTDLFDLAPFGYLTLDLEGRVSAANRIAADWLAATTGEAAEWSGQRIEDFVVPESRPAIRAMLAALRKGEGRQFCAVHFRSGRDCAEALLTAVRGDGQVMIAFVPIEPGSRH